MLFKLDHRLMGLYQLALKVITHYITGLTYLRFSLLFENGKSTIKSLSPLLLCAQLSKQGGYMCM